MNYEKAIALHIDLKAQIAAIDAEAKKQKAPLTEKLVELEGVIAKALQIEGMESAKTSAGTAYFAMHYSCTVADKREFFDNVKATENWDLLSLTASKEGVKAVVKETGEIPPGVNYKVTKLLTIRKA